MGMGLCLVALWAAGAPLMTVIYHCSCSQSSSQNVEVHDIEFLCFAAVKSFLGAAVLPVILCYRNWENSCLKSHIEYLYYSGNFES